ncbi:MAG: hypothetical protein NTZ38_03295 [Candidatus Taylorbacteria bacterium]|nr:hypothetical protein [Candidatus Taylorbacteria bacterium]
MKARYYIRYCDDFVILDESHSILESYIPKIADYLRIELKLDLHPRKLEIRKIHNGTDFLGYVSLPHYRILRTRTKNRMFRKIAESKKKLDIGSISRNTFNSVVNSYLGMLKHCKSERLRNMVCSNIMPLIIDGKKAREALLPELEKKIKALSHVPTLAIIQVGDRSDSSSFIRAKKSFAKRIGVNERHIRLPENVSQEWLAAEIEKCNADEAIQGIIVQLPLPEHLNKREAIDSIDPKKDVDALTSKSVALWTEGKGILPATARGIHELLKFYKIDLKGKKVTVVGRSELVGTPIVVMCRNGGAIVTVCHSKTVSLIEGTKSADILIVATGRPGLIKLEHVNKRQVVVDVGISRIGEEKLVGDVDFEAVKDTVAAISSVPGGVGPMTVFGLFENLVDLSMTD